MDTGYIDIHKPLVERCKQGDRKAQYELYKLYSKAMYNVCMRMVGHVGEAEDILQESFLEAFSKLSEFRAESTFGAWLKRIVINRSINYLRKRKLSLFEDMSELDAVTDDAYLIAEDEEQIQYDVRKVQNEIQSLPDGYRMVLSLYLLEGYDHSEIAQILKITESTSKSQFNRAKKKLKENLKIMRYAR